VPRARLSPLAPRRSAVSADDPAVPGGGDAVLRVEAGGPTAFVTALAFSPDGKTLYAGGYDKGVHTWGLDAPAAMTRSYPPGSSTRGRIASYPAASATVSPSGPAGAASSTPSPYPPTGP